MPRQHYSAHPCERDWILSVACKQRYCHLSKSFCRILLPVLALVAGVAAAKAQEGEAQAPGAGLSGLCPEEYARFAAGPVGASQVQEYYLRQHGLPPWQDAARRAQLLFLLEELRYDGLQPAEYRGSLQQVSGAGSVSFCREASRFAEHPKSRVISCARCVTCATASRGRQQYGLVGSSLRAVSRTHGLHLSGGDRAGRSWQPAFG